MLYVNPIDLTIPNINLASDENERKRIAGEEMERLFLYELLKEMRKTIFPSRLFPQNSTKEIYEDMLNDAFAGAIAKSNQLGIAEQIIQNMETMQRSTEDVKNTFSQKV